MPSELSAEQRQRVTSATEDVALAQREVERALGELTANSPRAQKIIITEVLQAAFDRLTAARQKLEALVRDQAKPT